MIRGVEHLSGQRLREVGLLSLENRIIEEASLKLFNIERGITRKITESWNNFIWKKPLRSSSPIFD